MTSDVNAGGQLLLPESVRRFSTCHGNVYGYLAVDRTVHGLCGGGIRIVPVVDPDELIALARTMTRKYAYLGLPIGGAKAAVVDEMGGSSLTLRKESLRDFARQLRPLANCYLPGKDVGMNDEEYRFFMNCLGRPQNYIADSAYHTAVSVLLSMEELLNHVGVTALKRSIIVEGFGKVGRWTARLAAERGWLVVAVADRDVVVYDPEGLDVDKISNGNDAEGNSGFRACGRGRLLPRNALCELPATIFSPCAGAWTIGRDQVEKLNVRFIVGGANNPVTDEAKKTLSLRGIVYFPDFVANCGGVAGSMIESLCRNKARAARILDGELRRKLRRLLAAQPDPSSLEEGALKMVEDILAINAHTGARTAGAVFSPFLSVYRRGWFPSWLEAIIGPLYMRAALRGL